MDKDDDYQLKEVTILITNGDMAIDKITLVNVASHKLKKQKLEKS